MWVMKFSWIILTLELMELFSPFPYPNNRVFVISKLDCWIATARIIENKPNPNRVFFIMGDHFSPNMYFLSVNALVKVFNLLCFINPIKLKINDGKNITKTNNTAEFDPINCESNY